MIVLPLAASLLYVIADVVLACVALCIGFFSALIYFRHTSQTPPASEGAVDAKPDEDLALFSQRADMAAQQIRDLTMNVATDVSDHNAAVGGFSDKLNSAVKSGDSRIAAEAIEAMLVANNRLQQRLAEAEKKIEAQTLELRTQESEARTDALTQLANRRAFDVAMEKCIDNYVKQKRPFSVLIFDVDHFKKFNDTHGHQAGDEVLRSVGRTLTKTVKSTDLACRYGGEEFALIMPGTKIEHARIAAERVRKAIEAMQIPFENQLLKVTASIGVAEMGDGENAGKLIRRADDSVYASKRAGRNCGHWHDGVECQPMTAPPAPGVAVKEPLAMAASKAANAASAGASPNAEHSVDLPDQTQFCDELRRRVAESQRFGVALSVMHLKVKDYDQLESAHGPVVGRLLLDSVAMFVKSTLREMDLIGRYDDREFLVMLPGSTVNEARQVGRRVRTAIANCSIPLGTAKVKIEVHIGVAHVQADDDAIQLIHRTRQLTEAAAMLDLQAAEV